MLAKRFGVPTIIVKLKDLALRPACQEMGVAQIIAPSISAAAEILGSPARIWKTPTCRSSREEAFVS